MNLKRFIHNLLYAFVFILLPVSAYAQPHQDCFDAQPVCGTTFFEYIGGVGFSQEFLPPIKTPGCFDEEKNSVWIIFKLAENSPVGAPLNFTIQPEIPNGEDFDWALFGPNKPCNELGTAWSCNASASGAKGGATGLEPGNTFTSQAKVPGTTGFNTSIFTGPNQTWYLLVNNFTGNKGGFTISFDGLVIFDCNPQPVCEVKLQMPKDITICQAPANPITIQASMSGGIYTPATKFRWYAEPPEARAFLDDTLNLLTHATIPPTFSGTIKYTYVIQNVMCDVKETMTIKVLPSPVATLEPIDPEICTTGDPINLEFFPPGGKFSGEGPIYNGILDPETWSPGSSILKYTVDSGNGCKKEAEIEVNIVEGPTAIIDFIDELCITDPITTLTAFDLTGKWGGAANAKGEVDPKKLGPGSHKVTYTVTDKQCVNTDEIFVEVKPLPDIFIKDPGQLCSDQTSIQLKQDPLGGTWTGVADSIGKIYPSTLGAGTYQGYYEFTDIFGCTNIDSVKIQVNNPPSATVLPSYSVCNIELNADTTKVDFTSLITAGDNNGVWVDVDSSGASGTFPELNFLGVPSGIYNFTYTTNTAIAPCKDQTYNVQIIVAPCECPKLDLKSDSSLCSDNGQLDLETIKLNSTTGSWSIIASPPGSNPAQIIGSSLFTTDKSAPGSYTIAYSLIDTLIGCPAGNTTTVYVEAKPEATLKANTYVCNMFDPDKGPVTLDFMTLITSGDNSGTWVEITNSGASGTLPNLDFTGVQPDIYTFKYTTGSAKAPCTESEYTATVIVQNCACPSVELVSESDQCVNIDSLDLNTLKITTEAGSWSIKTTPNGSNPATLNGSNLITKGKDQGTYILVFKLDALPPDGCLTISEVAINLNPVDTTNLDLSFPKGTLYNGIKLTNDTVINTILKNQLGCDSVVIADIKVTTGTNNQLNNGYFKLVPNPASSVINVISNIPTEFDTYKVFNSLGQEVISRKELGSLPLQINIDDLPSGYYVLKIKLKDTYISDTFIKN